MDKPAGVTTFSLVAEARRLLGIRKAGHVGTLDPLATGLAGVLAGPAVKLAPLLVGCGKVYSGEMRLGLSTDTDDVTGKTLASHQGPFPPLAEVKAALDSFLGERPQRPPLYSAVKVKGAPSYRAARRGEAAPPLPERPAFMGSCAILGWEPPVLGFRISVGSGFYVRSLARDLGAALGLSGGALQSLRRERLGPFDLGRAARAPFTREGLLAALTGPREALPELPEFQAEPEEAAALRRGARLTGPAVGPFRLRRLSGMPPWPAPKAKSPYPAGTVLVTCAGAIVALAEYSGPEEPQGPEGPPPEAAGLTGAAGPAGGGSAEASRGPSPSTFSGAGPGRPGLQPPRGPFLRPLRVFQGP
jgi:tRNA pseudouridine55 synthase